MHQQASSGSSAPDIGSYIAKHDNKSACKLADSVAVNPIDARLQGSMKSSREASRLCSSAESSSSPRCRRRGALPAIAASIARLAIVIMSWSCRSQAHCAGPVGVAWFAFFAGAGPPARQSRIGFGDHVRWNGAGRNYLERPNSQGHQDNPLMQLESTLTWPQCSFQATETMSTDACQFFYACRGCRQKLKPLEGDCCVFCSCGSVPCPPIEENGKSACCEYANGLLQHYSVSSGHPEPKSMEIAQIP